MKKRLQGLVAGILIGAMFASGTVFAKQVSETAEIFYNNIKIYVDGGEVVPKDANGKTVEPFIMNGTTYLPVRAISNAFDKDVEWDGATQSVYIGKKDHTRPDNYLDRIQYNDYKESRQGCIFEIITEDIIDYNNNIYTNGLLLYNYGDRSNLSIEDDSDGANMILSYPLNSQYKQLNGKIVLPKTVNAKTWKKGSLLTQSQTDIWLYGDGKLLYKATAVTPTMPFSFEVDTTGVNQLTIKMKSQESYTCVALTDLALYK